MSAPEWFTEAIESAIGDVLRESLTDLSSSLQHWLEVKLGLYKPNIYEKYFSRIIVEHATDEIHLADFASVHLLPGKARKIRFFKK